MNDSLHHQHETRNWIRYAILEVPLPAKAGGALGDAVTSTYTALEPDLMDALRPLVLPADFARKVLASARDAVSSFPAEALRIHLNIYMPAVRRSGQAWGFFRLDKNEVGPTDSYTISLYLYVE